MKKTYVKPEVYFESFELSTNIAKDCEQRVTTHTQGMCGIDYAGQWIFTDKITGCKDIKIEDNGNEYLCYHVPVEANNLFNS